MAPLTPESSPGGSSSEILPSCGLAASAMPITPSGAMHTCNSKLFCCGRLYPLTRPLGPHDSAIYHFAYYMTNPPTPPSPLSPSLITPPLSYSQILTQTPYIIRYQTWLPTYGGHLSSTRHFMPDPQHHTSFIEIKASTLAASSRIAKWVPNWRYLKFKCELHEGPWFTCYVLERREGGGDVVPVPVKGKGKREHETEVEVEIEGEAREVVDEGLSEGKEAPPSTPTRKIVKRLKM